MKKIVISEKYAFIYLNSEFYLKKNIVETSKAFEEFVKVSISKLGKYYVIKLEPLNSSHKLEKVANEFMNYTLAQEQGALA